MAMIETRSPQSQVRFFPFVHQREHGDVILGRPETAVFISLPEQAFEIVECLDSGKTIEEVQAEFFKRHGERPDINDLVDALHARGFVAESQDELSQPVASKAKQFHFTAFPTPLAQLLFSRPMLLLCGAVVLAAFWACLANPSLLPGWRALFFSSDMTAIAVSLMVLGLVTTFFHEMAHLIAAKAKGVSCRIGLGNRLWILVAETDMTGIWALPSRDRYLPLLAGPLFDITTGSILFLVLYGNSIGLLSLSQRARQYLAALVLGALLRILWQCFFFVRTDFYYVIANATGCRRLMSDTRDYLKAWVARLRGRGRSAAVLAIPARELRMVRVYSVLWVVGRALAFGSLFLVTGPLIWTYSVFLGSNLLHFSSLTRYQLIDSLLITVIQLTIVLLGLFFWLRSLIRPRRTA